MFEWMIENWQMLTATHLFLGFVTFIWGRFIYFPFLVKHHLTEPDYSLKLWLKTFIFVVASGVFSFLWTFLKIRPSFCKARRAISVVNLPGFVGLWGSR